jgi:hypothetical protein
VFSKASTNFLIELRLENCGVDDEELAAILKGLHGQKTFRVFYYKHNVLLEESLKALKPILYN